MPSKVNWPVMGGLTAHSTGATLALGDLPRSLNDPGWCLAQEAREPDLFGDPERFLGLAGVTSAAAESERGSDRQNGPPHRTESSKEALCLAVGVEAENRALLPHNQGTTGGQVGKAAAAR